MFVTWFCSAALSRGQVPDPNPSPAPAPTATRPAATTKPEPTKDAAGTEGSSFLGKDLPSFDPGTEMASWDGKHWNIAQNRLFQMRFEKYLNSEEENSREDKEYRMLIRQILDKLAPEKFSNRSLDDAWRLLPQASNFSIDANLCDALADAVYTVWVARRQQTRLTQANSELEKQRRTHEWNAQMSGSEATVTGSSATNSAQHTQRDLRRQPHVQRLAEVNARIVANNARREISDVQARIEFQALIVQFFVQRRFQHVLMATRFYRHLFSDGDTRLQVGDETKELLAKGTGLPPTVGTLDSIANEAIRDVREGVDAFKFLLAQNELESGAKRLAEAFAIGEYLPEIRTLPRPDKRRALDFAQKANRLVSALEVKDYALAETLVKQLDGIARDFDTAKPLAAIETAKTVSSMHLAKAKNAAVSGDKVTLETELKEATAIWPRNPALAEVSSLIFTQADAQQKALVDLDQLLSQKNYRQIFDDRIRFIAASALYPDRQDQLKQVLEDMQQIEGTIIRCQEIAKRGDHAGAWETAERMFQQFPTDNKLNQLRATLTTDAADFVRSIRMAQQLEEKGQAGSSLAWFLKAQKLYPPSEFARDGIHRLVKQIVPEG